MFPLGTFSLAEINSLYDVCFCGQYYMYCGPTYVIRHPPIPLGRVAWKKLIPAPIWPPSRRDTCGYELRCSRNACSKLSSIWSPNQTSKRTVPDVYF